MTDRAVPAEWGEAGPVSRVLFRVDGSARMGGGHIMRCLALADALRNRGATTEFICALVPDFLAELICAGGHKLHKIEPSATLEPLECDWDSAILGGPEQADDARQTIAAGGNPPDWIVVDHYRLDARWTGCVAPGVRKLVIDDLANRTHDCDLLVDQTFGRSARDYANLVPERTEILTGARLAMLRQEFPAARDHALARRELPQRPQRLLVSLGQTDVGGVTRRVLEGLADSCDLEIDVVLGPWAESRPWAEAMSAQNPRIAVHIGSRDMAGLTARADLAVGAAGTSAWERCCLGLPAVTLVLADNQRLVAGNLADADAILVAETPEAVGEGVRRLVGDHRLRMGMIAAAAAVTDGRGSERIADAMLRPHRKTRGDLSIRLARAADSRAAWLWRNDPDTRAASQTHAPVPWPDHAAWWTRALASSDRELLVAELDGQPLAIIRFDRLGEPAEGFEVSINLMPDARGGGLGLAVLETACSQFLDRAGEVPLVATIHRDNRASQKVFERMGFERERKVGETGFERYLRRGGA